MDSDINDVFECIAFSEDVVCKSGFDEGFSKGELSGSIEGYHFGYHRGISLGKEIGFYCGFVEKMLCDADKLSTKLKNSLLKFQSRLEEFPHENIDTFDFEKHLRDLRSFYKTSCSLSGLNSSLPTDTSPLKY